MGGLGCLCFLDMLGGPWALLGVAPVGAVSGHRFCPICLAVALDAAHFSENALLQPD